MKQEREGKMKKKMMKNKKQTKKGKKLSTKEIKGEMLKKHKLKRKVKKYVQGFLEFRSLTSQWLLAIHIQSFYGKNWFLTKNWPLAFEFY